MKLFSQSRKRKAPGLLPSSKDEVSRSDGKAMVSSGPSKALQKGHLKLPSSGMKKANEARQKPAVDDDDEEDEEQEEASEDDEDDQSSSSSSSSSSTSDMEDITATPSSASGSSSSSTCWTSMGLAPWIQKACQAMGFQRPTPVQDQCIPAILSGRDVMGCAETGSGKTAAFALPMLHRLSEDPYGIYGLVLTPTRELAIQIAEQFQAFGAPINLRHAVVIGGVSMVQQSVELSRRPHVVIATAGRLWDHLRGPSPPDLSKARFLVLDEADRLLCEGFEKHLGVILNAMTASRRQTLLFSATMTSSLEDLKALTRTKPVLFNLTKERTIPSSLQQQYLFMPAQVKACYLVGLLQKLVSAKGSSAGSTMIFVGTCQRCQEITEVLLEAGLPSVCLHSVMSQKRRLAALGKFKSSLVKILVSTDVASRGLDIPEVDLVVNYDLPRVPADYVHRVGRTARAGRFGRAISLVTQYDVQLVHNIEALTKTKMEECTDVKEDDVLKLLNPVAKATRTARMRLMEIGFDEKIAEHAKRKGKAKKAKRREKRNDSRKSRKEEQQIGR